MNFLPSKFRGEQVLRGKVDIYDKSDKKKLIKFRWVQTIFRD